MIMGDEQTWAERWDRAAADFLGRPVTACAQGTRTMGWSSLALGQLSGAAGMVQAYRGKRRAAGLPQIFLVAVTDETLHVLAMPKMNWNVKAPKAVKELAVWRLSEIALATEPVFHGIKLTIDAPAEGEHVQIQLPDGRLGERVVAAARAAVAA
ncbi:hypothetical protein [Patulibacter defluvii]|uniref:hypothetical protein n=1 Tax=Patulibacter defluvii TaxID=3095358 RepID=UPI002A75E847|nr:hypothetical protein [Patulibacter sp. DM4]